MEQHKINITDPNHLYRLMTAGNATLTFVSSTTGKRYTYKFKAKDQREVALGQDQPIFVSILRGTDNESDYSFLGTIFMGQFPKYYHSKKSKIPSDTPPAKGMEYITRKTFARQQTGFDIYHSGKCVRCNRTLTVPESIISGIGSECAKKMGF